MSFTANLLLIYYHSVAPKKNPLWFKNFLTLELKYFEDQLKYFHDKGFTFITLRELINPGKDLNNKKYLNLSFDDGYLDNFKYVYPLLKKYNAKATFFVNPLYLDKRSIVRNTLEDYWNGSAGFSEIDECGFLSWDEMRLMENSGVVDIQSHAMTHAKYFISDKITGFHVPGCDCLYPVGNIFPERLPNYIADKTFESLLPYGLPYFQSAASLIARRVFINEDFNRAVVEELKDTDWSAKPTTSELFRKVQPVYDRFKKEDKIIDHTESEDEFKTRVNYELFDSRKEIEEHLDKQVDICSWPHGESSDFAQKTALSAGYKTTTAGHSLNVTYNFENGERLPPRIILKVTKPSIILVSLETHYKKNALQQRFPYCTMHKTYKLLKHKLHG